MLVVVTVTKASASPAQLHTPRHLVTPVQRHSGLSVMAAEKEPPLLVTTPPDSGRPHGFDVMRPGRNLTELCS